MTEPTGRILIVTTNHTTYRTAKHPTGNWLSEVTHFYEVLHQAGYSIDITSPLGGPIPFDPKSMKLEEPLNHKWWKNTIFSDSIANTIPANEVKWENYEAIYYAGGHGVMWDFPDNTYYQTIARELYEHGKVVAAVCHGVGGLLNIKLSNGQLLVQDKALTGFSNLEERLAGLKNQVPFLLESALVERGAYYQKAFIPFRPHCVTTERLITGQNPNSAHLVGQAVLEALSQYEINPTQ